MKRTASHRHDDMLTTEAEDAAIAQYITAKRAQLEDRNGRKRTWQNTCFSHNFCSSLWWVVNCLEKECVWTCTDVLTHTYVCNRHYSMHICSSRTCDLLSRAVRKAGTICPVKAVALNAQEEGELEEPHYSKETLAYIKSAGGNTRWLDAIIHASDTKTGQAGTLCTRESTKQIKNVMLQHMLNAFIVRLIPLVGSFYNTISSADFKEHYRLQSNNQINKNIKKQCYRRKHNCSHMSSVPYLPIVTTKDATTCEYWYLNVEVVEDEKVRKSVRTLIAYAITSLYNNIFEYSSKDLHEILDDEAYFLNIALLIILCLYNFANYPKYEGRMLFSLLFKFNSYVTEKEYTETQNRVSAFFSNNKNVVICLNQYKFGDEAKAQLNRIL
ncbi:ORF70 [Ranid herpesvirus 2]|uniref:ORF70 n=1 Tax=Ranid herpesvirus 2 TaxID=389214 RepID=Q14W36_9VIRU|nr:ORF70 [Ranid herpesvirus 2]ABG25620.1 ORF70 [Ranid herpesvirus 2]